MLTFPMLLHSYCTSTPVPTLAVLPKPSWVTTKTTGVRDSRDYTTLNPDIENDESTKTGTDDSGFEEWKPTCASTMC